MFEFLNAILQLVYFISRFRFMFVGMLIGWGLFEFYRWIDPAVSDDGLLYTIGILGITGLIYDIRAIRAERDDDYY